ncbi:MAG: alginate export family protein [Bacteroidota bacterium]
MQPNPNAIIVFFLLLVGSMSFMFSQEQKAESPGFKDNRSEESYDYLRNPESNPYSKAFGDQLKFIPLNDTGSIHLSFGGSYRARLESFTNQNWTTSDDTYFSQRLSLHSSLQIGKHVRLFGELYHGLTTGKDRLFQDDDVDWHQGFVEFRFGSRENIGLDIRLGRQELDLGVARLVGRRDGTNIRRSFDLAMIKVGNSATNAQIFYGKEVSPQFGAFDNEFTLFDGEATNPKLWGAYVQWPLKEGVHTFETYYLGFQSDLSRMSDQLGQETRHSLGLRSFGKAGRFTFNSELVFQFGEIGESNIRAYNFETDWKYIFPNIPWRPLLGIKLDFSSGDRETGDDKLQTFNPLFVNPGLYSLAAVNTPANLTSFHPSITLFPLKDMVVYMDYALFYRTNRNDGLYAPPRFLSRPADGIEAKHIGDVLGINVKYTVNRNVSMTLLGSYFFSGEFIKASGPSENIFYLATTLNFLL